MNVFNFADDLEDLASFWIALNVTHDRKIAENTVLVSLIDWHRLDDKLIHGHVITLLPRDNDTVLLKYGRPVAKWDPWIHRANKGPTIDGPFGDRWIL